MNTDARLAHRSSTAAALVALGAGAALLVLGAAASAQTVAFPTRPVRLILPYPPGGGTDIIARPLAQRLSDQLRQSVLVDNRGGANGNIGMEAAAKAPPDGHTLVLALTAQLAVNPALYERLPYDPVRDFEPVTLLGNGPYVLLVHPSLPVKSVKELIALARARPGQLAYGSAGNGSGAHLAAELMVGMAGLRMNHVPYKGGGPGLVDLVAGNIQVMFATYLSSKPLIDAGRLRALAVSTARPLSGLALPTIAAQALPGFDAGVWYAVLAPAGTPRELVSRLHGELVRASRHEELRAVYARAAIEPIDGGPDELAAFMKAELAKWSKVVRAARVQVE